MTYLLRDDDLPSGFIQAPGLPRRTQRESYVPWALTLDERVVFARSELRRARASRRGLKPYDMMVSKARRRLCQSALGSIALNNRIFWDGGVRQVSAAVKRFMIRKFFQDQAAARQTFADKIGKYLYGTSYMSFGRISDVVPTGPNASRTMWEEGLDALDKGAPLATVLAIHDGVAKFMIAPGDAEKARYAEWAAKFRADRAGELFQEVVVGTDSKSGRDIKSSDPSRGRMKIGGVQPTTAPGITAPGATGNLPNEQLRNRGVDMYQRTPGSKFAPGAKVPGGVDPKLSPVTYFQDLDERNELFGAGPSGTTGTLLAAAMTFGNLQDEMLKQYMFAIIGYLIGGGMHSLHESLAIMQWLPEQYRMEYNPGSFLRYEKGTGGVTLARADDFPALPMSFIGSPQFEAWRERYYDIVVLGGIHWMFNRD